MGRDRVVSLMRTCASSITVAALAGCSQAGSPTSVAGRSPSALPQPSLRSVYRAALGISVPVPEGWSVEEYQGTAVTDESPPQFIVHGPRFTFEKLAGTAPALAFQGRCGGRPASHAEGPTAVAGHPGSYQYLCSPRTFIGSEWTVLIPDSSTPGTWRITFLGADGIGGRSQMSTDFTAVLAAFSSTVPAPPHRL